MGHTASGTPPPARPVRFRAKGRVRSSRPHVGNDRSDPGDRRHQAGCVVCMIVSMMMAIMIIASLKQSLERIALGGVFIRFLRDQLFEVPKLPFHSRQVGSFRDADGAKVLLRVVEREQERPGVPSRRARMSSVSFVRVAMRLTSSTGSVVIPTNSRA